MLLVKLLLLIKILNMADKINKLQKYPPIGTSKNRDFRGGKNMVSVDISHSSTPCDPFFPLRTILLSIYRPQ